MGWLDDAAGATTEAELLALKGKLAKEDSENQEVQDAAHIVLMALQAFERPWWKDNDDSKNGAN